MGDVEELDEFGEGVLGGDEDARDELEGVFGKGHGDVGDGVALFVVEEDVAADVCFFRFG